MMKFLSLRTILIAFTFFSALPLSVRAEGPDFSPRAYISGTVFDGSTPMAGVRVMGMSKTGGMVFAVSAPNGNYALGVWDGDWKVSANKKGYFTQSPLSLHVGSGETAERHDIHLRKSTAYIEGIVVDERDRPLPRAMVTAVPMPKLFGGQSGEPMMGPGSFFQAAANGSGDFSLQTMAGNYMLMGFSPGYQMSSMNPIPPFPGLENIPAQYRAQVMKSMKGVGIGVRVAEGETKTGIKIILAPANAQPASGTYGTDAPNEEKEPAPQPNVLVGSAQATPNNVLHWSRESNSDEQLAYVIIRSTVPFGSHLKGKVSVFRPSLESMYGYPHQHYFSFTDSTAVSGKKYWYAVYEMGAGGNGPYSNAVELLTR